MFKDKIMIFLVNVKQDQVNIIKYNLYIFLVAMATESHLCS